MTRQFASIVQPFALIACLILAAIAVFPQSQATTGNIEGRVTDPNGAAVPGVTVTVTNQETALSKGSATDSDGVYRISFLPPGKYKVTTSKVAGFLPASFENATVTVGGQTPLDIQLSLSGADTVIVDVSTQGHAGEE